MMTRQDIAVKNQWNKLVLYTAGDGWDARLCNKIPSVCGLLRGKLRTESGPDRRRYDSGLFTTNDEAVIIFRVAAGGMAHLHNGQVHRSLTLDTSPADLIYERSYASLN